MQLRDTILNYFMPWHSDEKGREVIYLTQLTLNHTAWNQVTRTALQTAYATLTVKEMRENYLPS